jgi:Ca2+ transporting ATPase
MIMNSLGALALATEDPKESILDRPPAKRNEYIISRKMFKHILGMAVY